MILRLSLVNYHFHHEYCYGLHRKEHNTCFAERPVGLVLKVSVGGRKQQSCKMQLLEAAALW